MTICCAGGLGGRNGNGGGLEREREREEGRNRFRNSSVCTEHIRDMDFALKIAKAVASLGVELPSFYKFYRETRDAIAFVLTVIQSYRESPLATGSVVGALLGFAVIGGVFWFVYRRRRNGWCRLVVLGEKS